MGPLVMVIPLAILWSIWKEENGRVFEGLDTTLQHMKVGFTRTLFLG